MRLTTSLGKVAIPAIAKAAVSAAAVLATVPSADDEYDALLASGQPPARIPAATSAALPA